VLALVSWRSRIVSSAKEDDCVAPQKYPRSLSVNLQYDLAPNESRTNMHDKSESHSHHCESVKFSTPIIFSFVALNRMALIVLNRRSSAPSDVVRPSVTHKSSSSADVIRNRLLFRLGIYDPAFTSASIHHKIQREILPVMTNEDLTSTPAKMQPWPLLRGADREQPQTRQARSSPHTEGRQPVPSTKSDDDMHLQHVLSMSDLSTFSSFTSLTDENGSDPPCDRNQDIASSGTTNERRLVRVRFDSSVTVIPIPSHRSYDHRTRARLYVPKDELSFDIVRNTREFVYEGWDWRNAIEEDGMHICTASREFVHPVHVDYRDNDKAIAKYHLKFAGFTTSHPNSSANP
jgi:hypothetical protein